MTFAADRGDTPALRGPDLDLTWNQVDAWLRPVVNAMLRLDLGAERRLAIVAQNSAATLLTYVAATLSGSSAVAANFHLEPDELAFVLRDSRARAVFTDAATLPRATEAARLAGIDVVVPDSLSWAGSDNSEPPTSHAPRPTLVYTSGTTGRPKGVLLPPTSWVGGDDVAEHLRRLCTHSMIAHGRHLVVGPMYHSGPLTGTRLFIGGAPVTVLGRFDPLRWLETVDRDRIGSTIMVPTHFQRLLAVDARVRKQYDQSSLRYVLQVGAKCPVDVKREMISWLGQVLWESYGASEVGTTCLIGSAEWQTHPGSVGRAIPPFEAFVLDEDGKRVAPGTEGRLYFKDTSGHGISYLNNAGSPDPHAGPGEFTLGEIGVMDADGFVWITDRAADMVVSGGVNIYPAESEAVLATHPSVAEVACVGIPHPDLGEQVLALVVPADPASPPAAEELLAYCRDRLTLYKCPRRVEFIDGLARNGIGKLDKRAMRAPYWRSG